MTSPLSRLKVSSASGWGDVRTAGNRVRRKAVVRRQVGERRGRPGGRQKAKRGDGRDAPPPPPPPPPPDSLSPQPPALNISGAMDNSVPFIGAGGSGGGSGGGPGGGSGCCTLAVALSSLLRPCPSLPLLSPRSRWSPAGWSPAGWSPAGWSPSPTCYTVRWRRALPLRARFRLRVCGGGRLFGLLQCLNESLLYSKS